MLALGKGSSPPSSFLSLPTLRCLMGSESRSHHIETQTHRIFHRVLNHLSTGGDRTETSSIIVASGLPTLPRPSLDSLPVELADIIISLLPNKDKISLAQSSFRFLQLVASKLYDSPTMQEKEAVAFVTARVSRCFAPHLSRLPSFDLTHFFLFFSPLFLSLGF